MAGRNREVTEEQVLRQLWAIASDGEAKPAERLKALELTGRHLGMFQGAAEGQEARVQPVIVYGMPEGADEGD